MILVCIWGNGAAENWDMPYYENSSPDSVHFHFACGRTLCGHHSRDQFLAVNSGVVCTSDFLEDSWLLKVRGLIAIGCWHDTRGGCDKVGSRALVCSYQQQQLLKHKVVTMLVLLCAGIRHQHKIIVFSHLERTVWDSLSNSPCSFPLGRWWINYPR